MRSASSSASVMIESGVNEYESIGHVEAINWNGITYGLHIPTGFVLPSTITYECRMDVSASGFPLHDLSVGYVASHRRSITFSSLNGITISEPRPMVGPPGREVRTDFAVSVSSDVSFPFKWEVAAPCSDWNPYLKVNGAGEAIGVGEVGVGSTLGRETPMTAYFTPTEMGNLSSLDGKLLITTFNSTTELKDKYTPTGVEALSSLKY